MDHKYDCNLSKRQQNVIRSLFLYDQLWITVYYGKRSRRYTAYHNTGHNKTKLFSAITPEDLLWKMRRANEVNPHQVVRWSCANERAREGWPFAPTGVVR